MEAAGNRPDLGIFFHSGLFDKVGYSSQNYLASRTYRSRCCPADPDLQIRWEGGSHPDPETRGASLKKKRISALRVSVWSKNKVRRAPPAPSPVSATVAGTTHKTGLDSREFKI